MSELRAAAVRMRKVRRGLYEIIGVTHTAPRPRNGSACDGQIFAEWFDPEQDDDGMIPGSWECFCERCKECDPNGWATLKECKLEAPGYWMETAALGIPLTPTPLPEELP